MREKYEKQMEFGENHQNYRKDNLFTKFLLKPSNFDRPICFIAEICLYFFLANSVEPKEKQRESAILKIPTTNPVKFIPKRSIFHAPTIRTHPYGYENHPRTSLSTLFLKFKPALIAVYAKHLWGVTSVTPHPIHPTAVLFLSLPPRGFFLLFFSYLRDIFVLKLGN